MSVVIKNLGHRFASGPWLFRHLNATIQAGEVHALVGPSGSGKSTLLSLIARWATPAEGSIHLGDQASIAWVLQNPHGTARRSALDHVALPFLARGHSPADADAQARQLLEDFNVAQVADHPFATLSGGEAQRLLLARGIATAPDILLVDEPTAQLDQSTARHVAQSLTALRSRGIAVIIATHDHWVRDHCSAIIDLGDYADDSAFPVDGTPPDEGGAQPNETGATTTRTRTHTLPIGGSQ